MALTHLTTTSLSRTRGVRITNMTPVFGRGLHGGERFNSTVRVEFSTHREGCETHSEGTCRPILTSPETTLDNLARSTGRTKARLRILPTSELPMPEPKAAKARRHKTGYGRVPTH
jgi:hypothetical protein